MKENIGSMDPASDERELVAERIGELELPRAALRVLTACASAPEVCLELPFRDRLAERIFAALGSPKPQFNPSELACTAFRALLVDRLARHFFARHPHGLGVGVCPLLGTRAHRVRAPRWLDVDSPAVAQLRRCLMPRFDGWKQVEACFCHGSFIDALPGDPRRPALFVVDESVLPQSSHALVALLDQISARATKGSELVLAYDATLPAWPSPARERSPALELRDDAFGLGAELVRYPRLRFVDEDDYPDDIAVGLTGVNVVAQHYGGSVPALAHLSVW